MGSTRFPGKSLAEIDGRPILWYLFRQLGFCRLLERRILATSDRPQDEPLAIYAASQGWDCFRGAEADVLLRYHDAAAAFGADGQTVIVRVTGDDIWPDPYLIDAALNLHASLGDLVDAVFTADDGHLPYGAYVETYRFSALRRAHLEAREPYDREHVSPYIKREVDRFPRAEIAISGELAAPPLSIDTPEDLRRNAALLARLAATTEPPYRIHHVVAAAAAEAGQA